MVETDTQDIITLGDRAWGRRSVRVMGAETRLLNKAGRGRLPGGGGIIAGSTSIAQATEVQMEAQRCAHVRVSVYLYMRPKELFKSHFVEKPGRISFPHHSVLLLPSQQI